MKVYRSRKAGQRIRETYDALLARWGVPFEEMDIPSAFGTTHVVAAGDPAAEPVILLHGVGDDSALMWLYNAKALAGTYRIYAVDTIGGPGKSEPGAGYGKGFDEAAWMDAVLDGLGLRAASLVGTSHGAYVAQYYAAMRPGRVRRVVCLAGTLPVGSGSPMKTMMRIFLPEALFPTAKNTERLIRKLTGTNSRVFLTNPLVMEHYRWLLKGFDNMAMRYHAIQRLTQAQVEAIRPKVLYLAGEEDPFQQLGGKQALLDHGMQCRFFEGVGHAINHEIADEVNAILLAALS